MDDQAGIKEMLRETNQDFRKLEGEHHRLERELRAIIRHKTLTPVEEIHKKQIQVEKLQAKDMMESMVRAYQEKGRSDTST